LNGSEECHRREKGFFFVDANSPGKKEGGSKLYKVFVYGTLMRNFWNHKVYLEGRVSRITRGQTCGLLYHLPEGYPALLEGGGRVKGEIIEPVDVKLLK
jgi:gamma-glutamylcyclotransferase (GGCT)/AIG2-like uncharacterized protein YtfP